MRDMSFMDKLLDLSAEQAGGAAEYYRDLLLSFPKHETIQTRTVS